MSTNNPTKCSASTNTSGLLLFLLITTNGSYTVHTFTSSGSLIVAGTDLPAVQYLVVAGGGSGGAARGSGSAGSNGGGGGGGGSGPSSGSGASGGAGTISYQFVRIT